MSKAPQPLNYGRLPERALPLWARLSIVIAMVSIAAYLAHPHVRKYLEERARRAQFQADVRRCLADAPPRSVIAYENEPDPAYLLYLSATPANSRYMLLGRGDGKSGAGRLPDHWFELRSRVPALANLPSDPVLFMHERQTPGGTRRLVTVIARVGGNGVRTDVQVQALTLDASGADKTVPVFLGESPGPLLPDVDLATGTGLRIFAGQSDPRDPSRFVIEFEIDGVSGAIHGQLQDGDRITMSVRR
jgi:hypothetical protein